MQHDVRSSHITQRISFYRSLPRIDFATHLDWQEPGNWQAGIPNLKVAFTARLPQTEAWFETPFAAVNRPSDGQEVPALRWADIGGETYGFALLNDSKYGYDALGGRLRLTLVRSGYSPDEIADRGTHDVRYRFVPHAGDWRQAEIVQQATSFNQPLIVRSITRSEQVLSPSGEITWRPEIDSDTSVLIAGMKLAQSGQGRIIRLYESQGRDAAISLRGLPHDAHVWKTTIVEDRQQELMNDQGTVQLQFHPWQVCTLLVLTA